MVGKVLAGRLDVSDGFIESLGTPDGIVSSFDYESLRMQGKFGNPGNPQVSPRQFFAFAHFLQEHHALPQKIREDYRNLPSEVRLLDSILPLAPETIENPAFRSVAQILLKTWNREHPEGGEATHLTPVIAAELSLAQAIGPFATQRTCPFDYHELMQKVTDSFDATEHHLAAQQLGFSLRDYLNFVTWLRANGYKTLPPAQKKYQQIMYGTGGTIAPASPEEKKSEKMIDEHAESYLTGLKIQLGGYNAEEVAKNMKAFREAFAWLKRQNHVYLDQQHLQQISALMQGCGGFQKFHDKVQEAKDFERLPDLADAVESLHTFGVEADYMVTALLRAGYLLHEGILEVDNCELLEPKMVVRTEGATHGLYRHRGRINESMFMEGY